MSKIAFDMLFGPAYKGIPLVALTAAALAEHHGRDLPFCFNRKEIKEHGEGGAIVGAPVSGRVLILDDVITAGTAIRETITLIRQAGGEPAGVSSSPSTARSGATGSCRPSRKWSRLTVSPWPASSGWMTWWSTWKAAREHRQFLPLVQDYRERYGVTA